MNQIFHHIDYTLWCMPMNSFGMMNLQNISISSCCLQMHHPLTTRWTHKPENLNSAMNIYIWISYESHPMIFFVYSLGWHWKYTCHACSMMAICVFLSYTFDERDMTAICMFLTAKWQHVVTSLNLQVQKIKLMFTIIGQFLQITTAILNFFESFLFI